jgi:hypothetical protein
LQHSIISIRHLFIFAIETKINTMTAAKFSVSAKLHNRANKAGKHPVYATYTYGRETTPFPTGLQVSKSSWDDKKKLAVVGSADALDVNGKLQQMQTDLLAIATSLIMPSHDTVKRRYTDFINQKAKENTERQGAMKHGVDMLFHFKREEKRVQQEVAELERKRNVVEPLREALYNKGLHIAETTARVSPDAKQLADLFNEYAGTGEIIPGQFYANGKPRRHQGTLSHYKPDSYKHVRSMWQQLEEFSLAKNYPLTLQTINLTFYKNFGDYILFEKNNYDNHFGSLIKRLKTFLNWCETDKGAPIHPHAKSKKFRSLVEENEVIILSDEHYHLLDQFRHDPLCKAAWVKYIDLTLFQSAMGLRHSDMKRASWRVEGSIVDDEDKRLLRGATQKNKSTYMVPVHLNPTWTIDILEKYNYDFNETARSGKHKNSKNMVSEQKLNSNMKEVLKALGEKHGIFKNKITIFKRKWGQEYEVDKLYQWEIHSSHDNRRAFITRLYRKGYSEKIIAKMVGTKSLPELRKYQQVDETDVMRMVTGL